MQNDVAGRREKTAPRKRSSSNKKPAATASALLEPTRGRHRTLFPMKNSSVSVPCQALTRTVLAVRLDGYCQWGDTSLASYNERMVLWPELSPRPQAQVRRQAVDCHHSVEYHTARVKYSSCFVRRKAPTGPAE